MHNDRTRDSNVQAKRLERWDLDHVIANFENVLRQTAIFCAQEVNTLLRMSEFRQLFRLIVDLDPDDLTARGPVEFRQVTVVIKRDRIRRLHRVAGLMLVSFSDREDETGAEDIRGTPQRADVGFGLGLVNSYSKIWELYT